MRTKGGRGSWGMRSARREAKGLRRGNESGCFLYGGGRFARENYTRYDVLDGWGTGEGGREKEREEKI